MAAVTSHHDETRQGVGVTAHVCAYVRGVESAKSPADRMIHDPYASALAGEVAEEYMKKAGSVGYFLLFSSMGRSIIRAMSPIIGANANFGMVDAMVTNDKLLLNLFIIYYIQHVYELSMDGFYFESCEHIFL